MFKLFAIILVGLGIYIGINYNNEITEIVESDAFEQVQEKLVESKNQIIEQIEEN